MFSHVIIAIAPPPMLTDFFAFALLILSFPIILANLCLCKQIVWMRCITADETITLKGFIVLTIGVTIYLLIYFQLFLIDLSLIQCYVNTAKQFIIAHHSKEVFFMANDYGERSLQMHYEKRGKIEIIPTVPVKTSEDLSPAYTPGVATPCLAIQKDPELSFCLTRRWNTCLVVTDGTAVLGLGDIGPEAGMPVMEGKCVLFKAFGNVDVFPLCIKSKDVDEIVNTVALISGSFGGVNLEDISAPRCFEIEKKLKERCDIPIFHDDQHGTAVVTLAGLINACKLTGRKPEETHIVVNGAGAAV